MTDLSQIREHMEVIGADGVHVGTVDKVEGERIKLTKLDSGQGAHKGHHHYIPSSLSGRPCSPLRSTLSVARTRVVSVPRSKSRLISGTSQSGGR